MFPEKWKDRVELSSAAKPVEESPPTHATSAPDAHTPSASPAPPGSNFLRVWFTCSNTYARAIKAADGQSYCGRCPACGKAARFKVGPGGSSERFFQMSCRG